MPDRHGRDRSCAGTADRPHDRDAIIGGSRPRREPTPFDRQALAGRSAGAAGAGPPRLFHAPAQRWILQRQRSGSLVRRGAGSFCRQAKGRRELEHLRGRRRRPECPPDHQGPGGLPKSVLPGHALHARFSGALAPDHVREQPRRSMERVRLGAAHESLLLQARRLDRPPADLQPVERRRSLPAGRRPAGFHELATVHAGARADWAMPACSP